ncbi:hypothetical protein Tco_0497498 [Tanacetum coccineum]
MALHLILHLLPPPPVGPSRTSGVSGASGSSQPPPPPLPLSNTQGVRSCSDAHCKTRGGVGGRPITEDALATPVTCGVPPMSDLDVQARTMGALL